MKDVFAPNGGAYLLGLLRHLSGRGVELEESLIRRHSFRRPLEAGLRSLPVHEHSLVLEVAEALSADTGLGYRLAQGTDLLDGGLTAYALAASSTVAEAFQVLSKLCSTFRFVALPSQGGNAEVELCWDYGSSGQFDLRHWSEFTAALLARSLRELTGGLVTPLAVEFTHAQGTSMEIARDAVFVVPRYAARINRLIYARSDLDVALTTADPRLLNLLLEHADLLRRIDDLERGALAIDVERLIIDGMAEGQASLAHVADRLGISQRTLSRRLASEGTSFFNILEGVRKSLALRYLRQNDKSLSEVSYLLGYASLSSFNDAFRRWTGQSPGTYRSRASLPS